MQRKFLDTQTVIDTLLPHVAGESVYIIISGVVYVLDEKASTSETEGYWPMILHSHIESALRDGDYKHADAFENKWACKQKEGAAPIWRCYAKRSEDAYWVFVPVE